MEVDKVSSSGRRNLRSNFIADLFNSYWKQRYLVILFIPAIIYYVVFCYVPIYGLQIAFKDYVFVKGIWGSPWIGFDMFKEIFKLGSFWEVFGNTIIISFYKLIFGFPAPIIFAILLNEIKNIYFKKTVQTISYLPYFISWIVLGGLFLQFLSPTTGPVNMLLQTIGLKPVYFLGDPDWFRFTLVIISVWKELGWGSIIYIAAITSIDAEIYEAANIDGASRIQRIIHVTLPSLTPVVTIMLIFAVGRMVNDDFDQIFNLYNPSVYKVGDVLSTYTYRIGLLDMRYSFSTAVGLFKNVIAFVLIIITNSITKRINEYGIW